MFVFFRTTKPHLKSPCTTLGHNFKLWLRHCKVKHQKEICIFLFNKINPWGLCYFVYYVHLWLFWAESFSQDLHIEILFRKKIHIQSEAKIVWHRAPKDRWCHLHPRVRIVPARFVDNDLFKWKRGKNPWALFLSKCRTFTAIENY